MAAGLERTRKNMLKRTVFLYRAVSVCLVLLLWGCATVGRDFSASKVYDIQIGKTTQSEIQAMFGPPRRVGIEDGRPTWTYANYHYSAFSAEETKDLVVRFDANNVVRSYTFNTSDPADIRKQQGSAGE
jgi:SmpA / OmlA family